MRLKSIFWLVLSGSVIAAAAAFVGGWQLMPQRGQDATPKAQGNVVAMDTYRDVVSQLAGIQREETSQACQAVMDQMATIQQIVQDEKQLRRINAAAAIDEVVAQEFRIDTSKCPTDFRMAELRFITAEDSARLHAQMEKTLSKEKSERALGAVIEMFAMGSPSGLTRLVSARKTLKSLNDDASTEKIADEQKQDLSNVQSAFLDFAQVAMKYGVK